MKTKNKRNTIFRFRIPFIISVSIIVSFFPASCNDKSNNNAEKENSYENVEEVTNRPMTFPSDDEFLDFIQQTHLNYMWEGAEKTSGLACERIHLDGVYPENDADVVTTGGSGFGIAGLIVGIERAFIPRSEGVARLHQIVDYFPL